MGNSPARSAVDVGSVIADTYTIEALIGRGGMGVVFLASHRRLPGKKVAIKILHAELTDDEVVARFRREALIASQLNHPNIVDVTDFNVTPDGTPYLILEYLHGESLYSRIKLGPMPLDQVLPIIRQVGSAVAAANREGIVHRDLKPQNIFLVPKEVDGRLLEIAKVLDFGISKIRGSQTVKTQESTLLGTPQYMAPEQATGQHTLVDERTDIFALGAIVYEMLSGQPAFSGANIPEVVFKVVYEEPPPLRDRVPGLPPAITAAVARAMAKGAADRFPTVGAFVEALTGQPLLQLRAGALAPPEVGFAIGSKHRSTGHDAFAQTMGSVDQSSPLAAVVPMGTVTSDGATVDMPAPTPAPARDSVPTVPAIPSKRPAPRRRTALIAGLALVCGAAAATVVATRLMRSPAAPAQPTVALGPGSGSGSGSALAVPAVPPDAAQLPVAPPIAPAATPDAGTPAPPRPDAGTPTPTPRRDAGIAAIRPSPPDEDSGKGGPEDEVVTKNLADAESALAAGQFDRAERLANSVIVSPEARAPQRARAHAVRGIVKCTNQHDQEGAVIDLRNLGGFRALQQRLIAACKRVGIEL
jgi:eukaryotic-like serine/threonine-protein kinase